MLDQDTSLSSYRDLVNHAYILYIMLVCGSMQNYMSLYNVHNMLETNNLNPNIHLDIGRTEKLDCLHETS
jgi:hypothetical protein